MSISIGQAGHLVPFTMMTGGCIAVMIIFLVSMIWANLFTWRAWPEEGENAHEPEEADTERTDESAGTFTSSFPLSMLLETSAVMKFFYNSIKG